MLWQLLETKMENLQIVIVTTFTQREIVKKKQAVVSVVQNSRSHIVNLVRSVTLATQIVEHVNVIWMALMDTIANRVTEFVHANGNKFCSYII